MLPSDCGGHPERRVGKTVGQRAIKDEDAAHPVASAWRPTLRKIVDAFVRGDYALKKRIPFVAPIPPATARQMKKYVAEYGETLRALPDGTWSTSVAQWMGGTRWEVLVDLWTVESGRSDMVLHVIVSEAKNGFRIKVHLVYVP
jgi:hypothetical protein